jgi:transposase
MFDIPPQTLQYWYKHILSDYLPDIEGGKWHPQKIDTVDKKTGEVKEKPVYIFKKENLGEKMSIDDKAIGRGGFSIFSNHDTGKIALMLESVNAKEVEQAMKLFGDELVKVKNISMDMSPTYALVARKLIPQATVVIDKFHVMKYVYEAVSDIRNKIKKELTATLTKGKKKTKADKRKLSELEELRRIRYAITQSPDKWSDAMTEIVMQVFEKHSKLRTAYLISQNFKYWYSYHHRNKPIETVKENLYKWYQEAKQIEEFESVIKMIRKHEQQIINFFQNGITNANAERTNGKIERFITNNYGIKDKDFSLYRIAGYFS